MDAVLTMIRVQNPAVIKTQNHSPRQHSGNTEISRKQANPTENLETKDSCDPSSLSYCLRGYRLQWRTQETLSKSRTEKRYCQEVDSVSVDVFRCWNVEIEELQRYCVYLHLVYPADKKLSDLSRPDKFIHWISAG